jgi:hypothetical protein
MLLPFVFSLFALLVKHSGAKKITGTMPVIFHFNGSENY